MKNYRIPIIFFIITIAIFWQFFFKGLYPFPGNYMIAWYEPWKTDNFVNDKIIIPHKAVADDTFRYLYPFKNLGINALKNMEIPLWNPYNGAGMPLLATYQWSFFNPFNIFFFFFSAPNAWSLYVITQAFLLGFLTYLYCKKIKISMLGSLLSAISFLFSGFVIARLIFGNIVFPLVTLPILLYLIEDYVNNLKSKKILLVPPTVAFMFFSGHPHMQAYVLITAALYFLYRILTKKQIGKMFINHLLFILLVVLGIGIAAIQLIPTVELYLNSNVTTIESSKFIFNRFLLPPTHLINIFIPNYFGNQATYNYWGAGDYIESVASIGLIPSFLAYFALVRIYSRKAKNSRYLIFFFFAMTILSALSTINWLMPKLLYSLSIPLISTSPPSRIFFLTSFSLAILAGYGFDSWLSIKKTSKRLLYIVAPFLGFILLIVTATFVYYKMNAPCNNLAVLNCRNIALRNTILEFFTFTVAFISLSIYVLAKNNYLKRSTSIAIILIILFIGLYNANKFLPFTKTENFMPLNTLINNLRKNTANNSRIFGLGKASIKTNFSTHYRLYDPNYYDPLYIKRYGELVYFSNNGNLDEEELSRSDVEITNDLNIDSNSEKRRVRLLDILGVKQIFYKNSDLVDLTTQKNVFWNNNDWSITDNTSALSRVYLVNNYEIIADKEKILSRLFNPQLNISDTVILEKHLNNYKNTQKQYSNKINEINFGENKVNIEYHSQASSILVLTDNYYPGWKAYVDGKETEIYRANYTFRAIELPKGKHIVKFLYEPESFRIGAILSGSSLFLYLSFCIIYSYILRKQKNNA